MASAGGNERRPAKIRGASRSSGATQHAVERADCRSTRTQRTCECRALSRYPCERRRTPCSADQRVEEELLCLCPRDDLRHGPPTLRVARSDDVLVTSARTDIWIRSSSTSVGLAIFELPRIFALVGSRLVPSKNKTDPLVNDPLVEPSAHEGFSLSRKMLNFAIPIFVSPRQSERITLRCNKFTQSTSRIEVNIGAVGRSGSAVGRSEAVALDRKTRN